MLPGDYAVETFFMISGFYMSLVLRDKYCGLGKTWKFYSNRYARLYPVYFITMIGTWVWFLFCWWWLGAVPANNWISNYGQMNLAPKTALVFSNWTMLGLDLPSLFHYSARQGFMLFHFYDSHNAPDGSKWAGEFRSIPQAWSVGLEIWFYCLAPLFSRLSVRWLVVIGILSAALKLGMECSGLNTYFFFPAQLGYFVVGMLAHRYWHSHKALLADMRYGWLFIIVAAIWILCFPFIPVTGLRWIFYAFVGLSLPIMFAQSKTWGWDRWVGNLSYPLYIVHMLALGIVSASFKIEHSAYLVFGLSLVISIFLMRFVEEPLDRWRQSRAGGIAVS